MKLPSSYTWKTVALCLSVGLAAAVLAGAVAILVQYQAGTLASPHPEPAPVTRTVTDIITVTVQPEAEAEAVEPVASVPTSVSGDGQYVAGEELATGTYRSAGPSGSGMGCLWRLYSDTTGDQNSMVDVHYGDGSTRVTVREGQLFEIEGCQVFTRVS